MSSSIAVVGQGIIGLTCASKLLDRGHSVEILSREESSETTSMAAGAFWWPHKIYPQDRVARWARETFDEYATASRQLLSGIQFREHLRFCDDPDDHHYVQNLVEECREIDGAKYGLACHEAFLFSLPMIEVPIYMNSLRSSLEARGARFEIREVESPLELFPAFKIVINCTGVQARHFVDDQKVFPIRGQSVQVSLPKDLNPASRLHLQRDQFTLVLPRSNDVILGGTSLEGDWDRTTRSKETEKILRRSCQLVPEISESRILGTSVGLRPGRPEVRLEIERDHPERPVVHNYGHGGGGFTVAWGCANEVANLVDCYLATN